MVKYDLIRAVIRPYVTAGINHAFLINAEKEVEIAATDNTLTIPLDLGNESLLLANKNSFENQITGYILGGGVSWDPWNIRIVAECTYRDTFTALTKKNMRFAENQLASLGDTEDELTLRNLNITFAVLFPLRFLGSDYTGI
jgi:opacity protein-like surface antigen